MRHERASVCVFKGGCALRLSPPAACRPPPSCPLALPLRPNLPDPLPPPRAAPPPPITHLPTVNPQPHCPGRFSRARATSAAFVRGNVLVSVCDFLGSLCAANLHIPGACKHMAPPVARPAIGSCGRSRGAASDAAFPCPPLGLWAPPAPPHRLAAKSGFASPPQPPPTWATWCVLPPMLPPAQSPSPILADKHRLCYHLHAPPLATPPPPWPRGAAGPQLLPALPRRT